MTWYIYWGVRKLIRFNEHEPKRSQLDLTPLIDVVFLLLIFFMLTSCYAKPQLPVALPEAESGQVQGQTTVVLTIKADGSIYLAENKVAPEQLSAALAAIYKHKSGSKTLEIQSDKVIPFGSVVKILDEAKKAGAENISIATEPK